ncbi:hypothetical protein BOTBODRAFT_56474 [Botryobasidium botryosum FD-172 SS1]|uniref:Uncharacterized protein n=1 Tax=Botryobasidium botryosum (strain FD-172 SS1) TaxID=930990 RepID=A0A067MB14_BOTB1|nr:hypothetical protein BOTBODRAFT_56474 [Botryobasidium botryosum FD-172 SS1]
MAASFIFKHHIRMVDAGTKLPQTQTLALKLNDTEIAHLVADIPFQAVGLLAFCVLIFALVMRRMSKDGLVIIAAGLFAFVAALLDLCKTLHSPQKNASFSIIMIRELGYSFSIGLRFFFFWRFVNSTSRSTPTPRPARSHRSLLLLSTRLEPQDTGWSGREIWELVFKSSILLLVSSVGILNIVWRLALAHFVPYYMQVYVTAAAVETLLSVSLTVELSLLTWRRPSYLRWAALRDHGTVIFAIMVGTAMPVGNLVIFLFSEGTPGRFIQAFELCILLVFVLVSAFYKVPFRGHLLLSGDSNRGITPTPYSRSARQSTHAGAPPTFRPDEESFGEVASIAQQDQSRAPYAYTQSPPWKQRGLTTGDDALAGRGSPKSSQLVLEEADIVGTSAIVSSQVAAVDDERTRPVAPNYSPLEKTRIPIITTTPGISFPPSRQSSSDVYPRSVTSYSSKVSEASTGGETSQRVQRHLNVNNLCVERACSDRIASVGSSGSTRSNFTLSNFPAPPETESIPRLLDCSASTINAAIDTLMEEFAPPRRPFVDCSKGHRRQQSFPNSTRGSDSTLGEGLRIRSDDDASGTRVNVTSFIGDLTIRPPSSLLSTARLEKEYEYKNLQNEMRGLLYGSGDSLSEHSPGPSPGRFKSRTSAAAARRAASAPRKGPAVPKSAASKSFLRYVSPAPSLDFVQSSFNVALPSPPRPTFSPNLNPTRPVRQVQPRSPLATTQPLRTRSRRSQLTQMTLSPDPYRKFEQPRPAPPVPRSATRFI